MIKKIVLAITICATLSTFAQEEKELTNAPYDFLDIFNASRRDKEFVKTNTNLLVAFGFNQALGNGNGIGDDYKLWGSGMFDVGLEFATRLQDDDLLRLTYGPNMRIQNLRINGNKVFSTTNSVTTLQDPAFPIDQSRFTQVSIIAPLHLEIGRRKLKDYKNGLKRYGDGNAFIAGVGGYVGYVSTSSQQVKYENEGRGVTGTITNDFVVNDVQYGLSVYAGFNNLQLFATYGLNDVFKNSPVQQQYLSFGLRLR